MASFFQDKNAKAFRFPGWSLGQVAFTPLISEGPRLHPQPPFLATSLDLRRV